MKNNPLGEIVRVFTPDSKNCVYLKKGDADIFGEDVSEALAVKTGSGYHICPVNFVQEVDTESKKEKLEESIRSKLTSEELALWRWSGGSAF